MTGSTKKGYACGVVAGTHAPAVLVALGAKWYYNWGPTPTPSVSNAIQFIPMVFSKKVAANPTMMAAVAASPARIVLNLNEPDIPQQANMTVPQAIAAWKTVDALGFTMGSPATAGNPTKSTGWLANFMKANPSGSVDFICVHWYGPPTPSSLLTVVDTLWAKYKKPIWITEFAVANWTVANAYTVNQVEAFMSAVLPQLNSRSYVARYAWKDRVASDPNMGSSCLVNPDGSLTALGALYAQF